MAAMQLYISVVGVNAAEWYNLDVLGLGSKQHWMMMGNL
jgi:hypothetical protein